MKNKNQSQPVKVKVDYGNGCVKDMYLQEQGSCASKVSPHLQSSFKTEQVVFNSMIKEKND